MRLTITTRARTSIKPVAVDYYKLLLTLDDNTIITLNNKWLAVLPATPTGE